MDNNTWNNTHISRVGQAMASDEQHAYEIMKELDVDYVLGNLQKSKAQKVVLDCVNSHNSTLATLQRRMFI